MMSRVILVAVSTAPGRPETVMRHGWPSGTFWSICSRVCVRRWISAMVSPALPITRPISTLLHSRTAETAPCCELASSPPGPFFMTCRTSVLAACTAAALPATWILRGTPSGKSWSIWITAPERTCRSRTVSRARPMTRPTSDPAGTRSPRSRPPARGAVRRRRRGGPRARRRARRRRGACCSH